MTRRLILLLAGMLAIGAARANDSTAELATGGLVFVKNDAIEMRSEDLYISAAEIRVRYRFFNRTDRDVTVHVAFPLPDIKIEHSDENVSIPTDDPVNIFGFTTRVNGRKVRTAVEQRVIAQGLDRTRLLRDLGIPLAPHLAKTNRALDRLPRQQWDKLVGLGLAEIEEYDVGRGMEQHLAARWTLQTTFFWQQTFPARAETAIEHRYRPSVGSDPFLADYESKYCMDRPFLAAVARATQASGSGHTPPFTEQRID